MNWQTPKLIAETLCLLSVAGSAAFFAWDTHQTQVQARMAVYNLSTAAYSANSTIASLSGPCKDIQGDYICPPLTQLSQTEKNAGILLGRSAQQAQQVGMLVTAVAHNLDTVGDSVRTVAGTLSGTASQATQTLQQAQTDLQTANASIQGIGPLISHSDATVTDLDALLKNPAIPETLKNTQQITWNLGEITFDGKRVADDATKKYFTPLPWYRKAMPYVTTGAKIAAYALPW